MASSAAGPSSLGPLRMSIVVAATLRNGIGAQGKLPWRLSRDMAYFRGATSQVPATLPEDELMRHAGHPTCDTACKNAVIMGRNTWESIPPRFRPLAGRINVIVSTKMQPSDLGTSDADTVLVQSFEDAVRVLQQRRSWRYVRSDADVGAALGRVFVIGGAALYRYVLSHTPAEHWALTHLLVTRIYHPGEEQLPCDVFLHEFRSPAQLAWENEFAAQCAGAELPTGEHTCPQDVDSAAAWHQASGAEHRAYLDGVSQAQDAGCVARDNGITYQFQLWRNASARS